MEIKLGKTNFKKLNIKRIKKDLDQTKVELMFNLKVGFNDSLKKSFRIQFHLKLNDPSKSLKIDCIYVAKFLTTEVITSEFKESNFPKINAPAIAYPFLRAAISTITLNSGFDPIILPTINFVKFAEEKIK